MTDDEAIISIIVSNLVSGVLAAHEEPDMNYVVDLTKKVLSCGKALATIEPVGV